MIHKPPPLSCPPPQALLREHDLTSTQSGLSLLLWKYVTSISEMLNKMANVLDSLPNVVVWVLMTGPIVFHFEAVQ